eukprot:TRINITY_DN209_c0_g1_i3.p1 TRINITY_DN209_c0_g1~~TRINITY_DN209_c0_g1_i3.p1  ORF type:complete len:435 (+),score=145.46 TRINITY_DN209_c0_g1_i3:43-1347(+)
MARSLLLLVCCFALAQAVTWSNWDKNQVCHPTALLYPSSEQELISIVQKATAQGKRVKVVGAGHSFSGIALTDGIMISLDKYNKVVGVDKSNPNNILATVQAGIRLKDLNPALDRLGVAMMNLGEVSEQSVAGATSTSTHGTGATLGSVSSYIAGIRIILANGTVVTASETHNPDLLYATRVGLGALGIVSTLTLRVVPQYRMQFNTKTVPLSRMTSQWSKYVQQYQRFEFYWYPFSSSDEECTLVFRVPTTAKPVPGCWPTDGSDKKDGCIDISYKVLIDNSDLDVVYTEMEYFVPFEHTQDMLNEWTAYLNSYRSKHNKKVELLTGLRWVAADASWMSPMYKRNVAVFSLMTYGTHDSAAAAKEFSLHSHALEEIGLKYKGRPHWGKMHYLTANTLEKLYPKFSAFTDLRDELDPTGTFLNTYLCRVLGEDC